MLDAAVAWSSEHVHSGTAQQEQAESENVGSAGVVRLVRPCLESGLGARERGVRKWFPWGGNMIGVREAEWHDKAGQFWIAWPAR